MFKFLYSNIDWALGLNLDKGDLSLAQMCFRAFLIYIVVICLTLINKRFIQITTPFDAILRFTIGSLIATAIIGGFNFFSALLIVAFLIFLNLFFAVLSFYISTFQHILFGKSFILFQNGKINWSEMRRHFITKQYLFAAIRKNANLKDLQQVDLIVLENDGEISVVSKDKG